MILKNKNRLLNNKTKSEKIKENENILQKNFEAFFQEHKEKLFYKDIFEDTPLHKIARLHDKTFFANICHKFNLSGILNEKLMSVQFILTVMESKAKSNVYNLNSSTMLTKSHSRDNYIKFIESRNNSPQSSSLFFLKRSNTRFATRNPYYIPFLNEEI